jgi:hypothetical protein
MTVITLEKATYSVHKFMSKGPYTDIKFNDFSGGLNTKIDSTMIADNESPLIQNIIFDGKGSIAPRLGSVLFGSAVSATGQIRRTWTTQNVLDQEVPIRQVDNATATWFEYYNDQTSKWEILDDGYTTGYDFGNAFYDYYTYFCSQVDHQRRWNGSYGRLSAAVAVGHTSCALSASSVSSAGFLSAGSIVVDGEEVYYNSANAGVFFTTAFTAAHAISVENRGVAQLTTSGLEVPAPDGGWFALSNTLPKGSIMYEMDAQMFITGASGISGNVVYYTYVDAPTKYTISAIPGGGGAARYPETTGSIKAITDFDSVLTVLKENTIRQLKFQELADGTAGSLEIVNRNNLVTAPKIGAINSKGLTNAENDVMFVSPTGWVKSLSKTDAGSKTSEISIKIRPTVEGLDFSKSSSIYFDGKLYVACATADSVNNNIVLVYDSAFGAWTKFVGWNVNDWFIYENNLYFGASNEIATYKALYNYDDNGSPYQTYWSSKQFDFGVPNEQKRLGYIYVEGYILPNTNIGVSAYFDGNTTSPESKSIDGSNTNYVSPTQAITSLGYNTWGLGTYGGSVGASFTLRKFRVWLRYSAKEFYNLQIKIGTNKEGSVYKITHLASYLSKTPGKRIPIESII